MTRGSIKNMMSLEELKQVLFAEVLWGEDYLDEEISLAYGSDLMSDVLAFVKSGSLLLTGLTNSQVIRTAEMAEIKVVCFVSGKTPQKETLQLAEEKGIPVLTTKYSMYEACGRLYKQGLSSGDDS